MTTRRARRQRQSEPPRTDLVTALKQFATSWGGIISFSVTLVVLVLIAGMFRLPPFSATNEVPPDPWGMVIAPNAGGVVKVAYIADTSKGPDASGAAAALSYVLKDRATIKDKDVRVELVTVEDACDADAASVKARELAADPQLVAVISGACPSSALAARAVFEETHHSLLVLNNHDPELTPAGTQSTFRVSWNATAPGKEAAISAFTDLGLRKALVAHDGTPAAETVAKEFTKAFRSQRKETTGQVPDVISVVSQTDVEAIGKRLPTTEPDLVFYAGAGQLGAALQELLTAQEFTGQYLVNDTVRTDGAFVRLGTDREGSYAVETALPKGTGYETWKEAFEKDNGAPGPLAAEANDALLTVLQALDTATQTKGNTYEIGRRIFASVVRGFPVEGVTGRMNFDTNGDRSVSMVSLVRFTDGAYVQVPKVTPTPPPGAPTSLTPSADTQAAISTALATVQAGIASGTPVAEGSPDPAGTPVPPSPVPSTPAPPPTPGG